jgi:hypothetical protein
MSSPAYISLLPLFSAQFKTSGKTVPNFNGGQVMLKIVVGVLLLFLIGAVAITVYVEREADYHLEPLGGAGPLKALILYHPSRDAHFSDELSLSVAQGLKSLGYAVDRATMTEETPTAPTDYAIVAVISNTYWGRPDRPTLHYLARARLTGIPAIGLMCGAGSTDRSQRRLDEALRRTGATPVETGSFWTMRPNDEKRMTEANRVVGQQMAEQFAARGGEAALIAQQAKLGAAGTVERVNLNKELR